MHTIRKEILGRETSQTEMVQAYPDYFPGFIKKGVENDLLDEKLLQFDLAKLASALKPERDLQFDYLGLQTLYDRYFLHVRKTRIEMPQAFFMRVAMGLSSMKSTAKPAPSSSTRSCPPSTSCRPPPRCSTAAHCVRNCRRAT